MKHSMKKNLNLVILIGLILALGLSACGGTPAPTQDVAMIQTQAAQTVVADMTQNAPVPTQAPPATEVPAPPGPTPDPGIPVAVVPTPAPGDPTAVANFNTTINSGPGTNYVVYGALLGGRSVKVIGRNDAGTWWAISVPVAPGGSGWVDAAWVTVSNAGSVPVLPTPPVPPTVNLVPPGPSDPQALALANVFVRTGPATNFPAYGVANAGVTGRVIGRSEDSQWWVVRIDPAIVGVGYGWVMAQYTQASNVADVQVIQNPESPEAVVPPPPASGVPSATATEFVNIRSGPGTNFLVYGVAAPGATGEVTGKSQDGGWWQVKIPTQFSADGIGWVSADFVTTQNTDSIPVVAAPPAPPPVSTTPPPPSGTSTCTLVSQSPVDGTVFGAAMGFETTWVLKNTGTTKWDQGEYDFRFVGAADNVRLHPGPDVFDLYTTVAPGATYNYTIPMIAPSNPGVYGEVWEIVKGNAQVCQFYVYIEVK